jgi:hypothetical protein
MLFPILTIFLILIVVFAIRRNIVSQKEQEQKENFWQTEARAGKTRKQDISNLDYIKIPLENLPLHVQNDTILENCEQTLQELSEKKILNLTGISNTDLKLTYGAANLTELSEYDQNFTTLARCLNSYGCRLAELNFTTEAVTVLEFAVSCKTDITTSYTTLSDLYLKTGQPEKIRSLITTAASLNSLSRTTILEKLNQRSI